jgi:hypothetical protein
MFGGQYTHYFEQHLSINLFATQPGDRTFKKPDDAIELINDNLILDEIYSTV